MKKSFELLQERGYIYQTTDEEATKKMLDDGIITFYLGIDPTADSLHIGHFFALTMVRRLQILGHHPIIIIGDATALVGDPTGKKDLRQMLTKEQVEHNKKEVKELIKKFVKTDGENPAIILNNSEWISKQSYVDFMRNIGVHFNINKMLATDVYKNRLEQGGLTFLEMGYMLMQAYDFVHLNREYNCVLQVGGSDQWANMVAGTDLSRKLDFADGKKETPIHAITCPLLVKADGEKMGKTSSGTLWVSREKTTVYDFYQMFMNSFDEDVERLLAFFSDFEMNEIKAMCSKDIREAKKIMAFEVTKLVHGEEEARKVKKMSEEIFSNKGQSEDMPNIQLSNINEVNVVDLLVLVNIASSKSEARRLIEQGGITINQIKITDLEQSISLDKEIIVRKGKKMFVKVTNKKGD
jgi:tyrosyl-tRNA synthetase